ncbi:MAG: hypothetical protein V2I67_11225 [Thermoanaerobaculales bacterium]|jgi:hypothetical protein|nr:hypothetical protein [Thermoanaerobaculales bacterium]
MNWIDQNLDAYRVIAEILTDLRPLVRERLEAAHGKEWFRDGIPEAIFEHLIENKEEEASIDWYENRYQEVISYAVFPDLFEIIIANPGLFEPIMKLAPSASLLNTRFLELEVMRSKIGRARQISEAEINFLTSFHLRFRRAVQELLGEEEIPSVDKPAPGADEADVEIEVPDPGQAEEQTKEVPPTDDSPTQPSSGGRGPARPPMRKAAASAEPEPEPEPETEGAAEEKPSDDTPTPKRETPAAAVKRALEAGDEQVILRELYREVTGIAEVIWTTNEIPTTGIWDRVSRTPWYETNFGKLELRPLSDFYELISQVRKKRQAGADKSEIQSFLNDSKFATILLALRDMFQQNHI